MGKKRSIIWTIPKSEFEKIVNVSNSYAEMLRHFGLDNGNNICTLRRRIRHEKINVTHIRQGVNSNKGRFFQAKTIEECMKDTFIVGKVKQASVKSRLIKFGLKEYRCECCGIDDEWNGKAITLQLDHINGNNEDNRIENLRFLCPNCHSQTPTFCGKDKKRKKRNNCKECGIELKTKSSEHCTPCQNKSRSKLIIYRDDLGELLKLHSYSSIGRMYDVTGNAVKKRAKNLGLL